MHPKSKIGRRGLLLAGGTALAMPALPRRARADAEYSLKLAHATPIDDPFNNRLVEAANLIKKESDGRVELLIFPNGQLGGDNDSISQVRSGAIDFCRPTGQLLSSILPVAATNALGFVWSSYDQIWPAMDGDLGSFLRGQIAAKAGMIAMPRMWDLGFRQVSTSNRPVRSAEDLVGLKLRVPVAPSLISMFTALKAAPSGLQFGEVYSALQTRVVDGQENPLSLVVSAKFYEVQKYVSMTNHVWDAYWIVCNARIWNRLPKPIQEVIGRNLDAGALKVRTDVAKLNDDLRADLTKRGLVINDTSPDSFRKQLQTAGFYKEWRDKVGPEAWALLEKHVGQLA